MIKVEEIKGLNVDELEEKVEALKKELMQYRFQAKTGKLEQRSKIGQVKKDIARVLTVINQKKIEVKA